MAIDLFTMNDGHKEDDIGKTVTQREYFSARLHIRDHDHQTLFRAGRLFQEYIVDAFAQIEQNRLRFIRFNQDKLRVELYKGLADALQDGSELEAIGHRVILPSKFSGSSRQMWELYQDAIAIVRARGKPDLFITITCNANWPEIREAILPNQTAEDRPDIVARVFSLKLKAMLNEIIHENLFGEVASWMYVIEFQKRGLPHCHLILIMKPGHKPTTAADVDSIVSAELPDPTAAPNLYRTVTGSMLHGPCGEHNPACPCMEDGICHSGYPKPFTPDTAIKEDSYPEYRRRDNGARFLKHGTIYTNQDVVPYSPYLCAKYDCHINVEVATSILAVKYLYKYIYKGHDRIIATLTSESQPVSLDPQTSWTAKRDVPSSLNHHTENSMEVAKPR
jgi:hypothetical protein